MEDLEARERPEDEDGRPSGRSPPFLIKEFYSSKGRGKVLQLEGVTVYETGRLEDCKHTAAIIFVGDFWGWNNGRTREIADHIAFCTGALTLTPRLLDSPVYEGGTDGDGLPSDFEDVPGRLAELKPWLMKYPWELLQPKIDTCLIHLRSSGAKSIAGIGFGFGAWVVALTSAKCGEWVCSVLGYPATELIQTFNGEKCLPLASRVKGTTLFLLGGDTPETYMSGGEVYEAAKYVDQQSDAIVYESMKTGWLLRGNEELPGIRPEVESAITHVTVFIRKKLWPPPVGANASTLRLASQDGDVEWVESLLLSGVAAGGKDAVDIINLGPIHYAAREGHVAAGKMLIDYQADANDAGGVGNETCLHLAAQGGHAKFVEMALQNGGKTEITDKASQTPMHRAAKAGHVSVVKTLLRKKAVIGAVDTAEQTALHFAAWHGKLEVIRLLLKLKMDVDPEDTRCQTPQDRAEQEGYRNCADLLQTEREHREQAAYNAEHKQPIPTHMK